MATILKAGNVASGAQITSDATGILEIRTGTGAGTTAITVGTDQSVNFSGTAQRITGDFSNATVANRVMFQNSTTNANTNIAAIPNGTATVSVMRAYGASDPTNAPSIAIAQIGTTESRVTSEANGTSGFVPMTFYTGGSETARFSATAKTLILSGGDTTANGTGITFPATQSASSNANTLDDYEEGTWNITVSYSGSTSGVTYAARTGYYTKMGNVVTVQGAVSLSSKGTGSGSVRISLPFQTIGDRGGLAVGNTQSITANNSPRELMVEGATSFFVIRYPNGTGNTTEISYGDISNSFYVAFGGTYLV
jgi:hypothetical protein